MGRTTVTPEIERAVDRLAALLTGMAPTPARNRQPVTHMAAPVHLGQPATRKAAPRPAINTTPGGDFRLPSDTATDQHPPVAEMQGFKLPSDTHTPPTAASGGFQLPKE